MTVIYSNIINEKVDRPSPGYQNYYSILTLEL